MGSIKDRVAIIGVGCTKFGELWEKDPEDLVVEAAYEALDDAGVAFTGHVSPDNHGGPSKSPYLFRHFLGCLHGS